VTETGWAQIQGESEGMRSKCKAQKPALVLGSGPIRNGLRGDKIFVEAARVGIQQLLNALVTGDFSTNPAW